jgi:hypothetical protein
MRVIGTRRSSRAPRGAAPGRGLGGFAGGAGALLALALLLVARRALLEEAHHVGLGDAPVATAAADLRGIQVVLVHQPAHRGAEPARGLARLGVIALVVSSLHASGSASAFAPRLRRGGGVTARLAFLEDREDVTGRHRGAVGDPDFLQDAVGRRGHLEHHLVGLEIREILVAAHLVARRLVPRNQRCVRHRLRQLGHLHFDAHAFFLVAFLRIGRRSAGCEPPSAALTRPCCCWLCSW